MIEGIDYSRGGPMRAGAVAAAGKHFVGRYAVNDLSPDGRGITASEYREMTSAGIDVFLYWEASEAWMLGGRNAGEHAARNAVENIVRAKMPVRMPVYYSHDIEPQEHHYPAIAECLKGAASVVGIERVGLYGGFGIIDYAATRGLATWFCQTYAWSGGQWSRFAHLQQYDNVGNFIGGVDVDLVRATVPHFGQASDFVTVPTTLPPLPTHRIPAPDKVLAQGFLLHPNVHNRFKCVHGGRFKTAPFRDADVAGASPYRAGRFYTFDWHTTNDDEHWHVSKAGSWALAKNFVAMGDV